MGALQRIGRDDVRLGMFIQSIDGAWLDHPFWKRKFLLTSQADLDTLRASGVETIMIDPAKGLGAPGSEPRLAVAPFDTEAPAAEVERLACASGGRRRNRPSIDACSSADEMQRAAKIVRRSQRAVTQLFSAARMGRAIDSATVIPVVDEITSSIRRNPHALITVAQLKTKDEYTYLHSVAVSALLVNLAIQLGFDDEAVRMAGVGGFLHDVGKVAMPEEVLKKPAKLTPDEYAIMKAHPERGFEMLRLGDRVPEAAQDICLHHHERFDGSGYPHGLAGEEISLLSRMAAVCDVYDAMTSRRPYKTADGAAETIAGMYKWEGHFDRSVLSGFIKSVGIYPVGTLVRLQSERVAMVVDQHPGDLTRPVVRIFLSTRDRRELPMRDVALADFPDDQILSRESPEKWGLDLWDARWARLLGTG